jgi:bifunctional DNA-binding transcriptional regulator/antitoxin component of YhaV-PrlF toxin-antitoxin module
MKTVIMGKRGTVVVPAKTRKRYKLDEGMPLIVEERDEGILLRPLAAQGPSVEVYTPERVAEFFLNNAMDKEDYREAREKVSEMGIDPDSIHHLRWRE